MQNPSITILSALLLLGSAQGFFLSFALLRLGKCNRSANAWLTCLLFILSISLFDGFMEETGYYLLFPHLIGLEWPTNFAYGPLAYFYVRSLTETKRTSPTWLQTVHFIPVILFYFYLIPLYFLSAEQKVVLWLSSNDPSMGYSISDIDPVILLVIMQIAVYLSLSLRLLVNHSKRIKENFSAIEAISLSWLRNLLIALFILWFMYAFTNVFSGLLGIYHRAVYLLHLMLAGVIYIMGYKGLTQPAIFAPLESVSKIKNIEQNNQLDIKGGSYDAGPFPVTDQKQSQKYKKSSLTDEQAEQIIGRLIPLMEKEKPHLELDITLRGLSEMLSISPNHLSQVINEKLHKSFFDFINGYRVEEAKRLLISPASDRFSILGIGMEAGFSSKSAFYTAFKRATGVTPSKFKEQCMKSDKTI